MNDDGNTSYVAAEDVFCDGQGMRSLRAAAFSPCAVPASLTQNQELLAGHPNGV